MSKLALPCVVCSKPLENVRDAEDNQPYGGTEFTTTGHYGSTIIDNMSANDPEFVVNICDTCIMRALDKGSIQSRSPELSLSRHPISDTQRAWVLAQNEKHYGSGWGRDQPVDYEAEMIKAGWPKEKLQTESETPDG